MNTTLTLKATPRWRVVIAQQSYTWTLNPHTRSGGTQTTHSSVYDCMFITQSQGLGMSRMLPNQNQTKQMNTWLQEEGLDWRLRRREKEKEHPQVNREHVRGKNGKLEETNRALEIQTEQCSSGKHCEKLEHRSTGLNGRQTYYVH